MTMYDINVCVVCGEARVSGSRLCAGCLVRTLEAVEKELEIKKTLVEMYKVNVERLNDRLKDCLAYGYKTNRENISLCREIIILEEKIREVIENGKGRKTENTEG